MKEGRASRTAVLVCQGRAVAHDRIARGRFADPVASLLLRDDERRAVETARAALSGATVADAAGVSRSERMRARMSFEMLRANGEMMAPRTIAIDDAVAAAHHPQLVILGAGLDSRAYRMKALADVVVFEVDHPDSQRDKQARAAELSPVAKGQRFVPVDFAHDSLDTALEAAGHDTTMPTTWIWEGVVPYLRAREVHATLDVVARRSALGSTTVVAYQTRVFADALGRWAFMFFMGADNPFQDEPRRSSWTPSSMAKALARHGFTAQSDEDLVTIADREKTTVRRSARAGHIVVAVRR